MAKKHEPKPGKVVNSIVTRALPYRPTCKLTPAAEPAFPFEGWRVKEFRDEHGNRYERNRDGEWERWFQVIEQTGERDKLLYRYKPKKTPVEYDDIRDRNDDFEFLVDAFEGWLADAEERDIYGPKALIGIRSKLAKIQRAIRELRAEVDILRPPELPIT